MTDNEIMKALLDCEKCPLYAKKRGFEQCHVELFDSLYDLINRQNAENERLKEVVERLQHHNRALCMLEKQQINRIKSEARKEFAERLKQKARKYTEYDEGGWDMTVYSVEVSEIDSLLKEMESESNAK